MIPFVGSLISVAVNITLNALLIFGLCGFPALGVQGAAIASLTSSIVGALVIYGAGIAKKTLLRTGPGGLAGITGGFIRSFAQVSMPAMLNESMWALGNLLYSSIFGHIGTGAYASITVVKSIEELTSVAVMGLCSSCAVMIGSAIGRGDIPLCKLCARRHMQLTVGLSVLIGVSMLALRQPLLSLFGVSQAVREDALAVLAICALEMVLHNVPSILVMGIFRAGGDTRYGLIIDWHHHVSDRPSADDAGRALSALERADDLSGDVSVGGHRQMRGVSPSLSFRQVDSAGHLIAFQALRVGSP